MLNLEKISIKYPDINNDYVNKNINQIYKQLKTHYNELFQDIINYSKKYNLIISKKNNKPITFIEKLYLYLNDIKEFPKCNICKNEYVGFNGLFLGYSNNCKKCIFKNNLTKEKIKSTNLNKYGVENVFQSKIVKEKIKETNLEKYGVENISYSNEIKIKKEKTCLRKYGVKSNLLILNDDQLKKKNNSIKIKNIKKINTFINKNYVYLGNNFNRNYNIKHIKCGNDFTINRFALYNRYNNNEEICTICNPIIKPFSNDEKLLLENIKNILNNLNLNITIDENIKFKNKYELDIYIPEISLGIEYNGLYWHSSEAGKNSNYHKDKLNFFNNIGIDIIQIFEDEWLYQKDIVLNRIKHILIGRLIKNKINFKIPKIINIGARKVEIREIEYKTSKEFLEKYHIQGGDSSKVKLGAYYKREIIDKTTNSVNIVEDLVGVMTFGKPSLSKGGKKSLESKKEIWELNRFAISFDYNVSGLASKFLKHFKKEYIKDNEVEIFSYADRRWSQGDVYKNLGFSLVKETDPNYYYFDTKNIKRIHRFNFRKTVLLNKYPEYNNKINELTGKLYTEFEIMFELGFYRIYDAGNLKFKLFYF